MGRKKIDDSDAVAAPVENIKDSLSELIAKNLDKTFKKELGQVVWDLDGPEESPTSVIDWISTGDSILDIAISNRPNGGLPVGKIVEITGLEASGKSLMCGHILAETQKKGGLGVFIDTEAAVSPQFMEAIGIDLSKLLYVELLTIEDIFQAIQDIVTSARNSDKDRLITIVVDSLAGATTKVEDAADFEKDGYATSKAILLSKAMRKITNLIASQKILLVFTNQLRQKLGAMPFSDPWTTSGGKAVDFHSSVKIRLAQTAKITKVIHGVKDVIGSKTKATVTKNRVGPPYRKAEFELYYDSGIDKYSSWINTMKEYKIVTNNGAWYKFKFEKPDGEIEDIQFQTKDFYQLLIDRPEVKDKMYEKICDVRIMQYKKAGEEVRIIGEDDISLDEDE